MNTKPAQISVYTIPGDASHWLALPWPRTCISTSLAGDLGPTGRDEGGRSRRAEAYTTASFPVQPQNVLICKQVHSLTVLVLSRGLPARIVQGRWDDESQTIISIHEFPAPFSTDDDGLDDLVAGVEADAIVSNIPGLVLGATVADCMPIFVRSADHESTGYRALVHSGWGGTGILAVVLNVFSNLGQKKVDIMSGPCIAAGHYAVPPERAGLFQARFGYESVKACADGQPGLDMIAANSAILRWSAPCVATLPEPDLEWNWELCTDSTFANARLHSYRRDGGTPKYGRMLALFG